MLNSRSYAGITRIRFKGPARRYLSTVQCPPRNEVMMERRRRKVNRAAQGLQVSVGQADILAIDSFAPGNNRVEKILLVPATAVFPSMFVRLLIATEQIS